MRHLYINKDAMVVLFVFLMGLFGLLAGFCMDIEFSSYGVFVLYAAMMVGIMVLAIYLNTKSPMCIMELTIGSY